LATTGKARLRRLDAHGNPVGQPEHIDVELTGKIFTKGIVKWGIRDAREIETWNVGLRFVEQASALAGYASTPFTPQRLLYRLIYSTPMRKYDVVNRFTF
jgi:hypothetical protein